MWVGALLTLVPLIVAHFSPALQTCGYADAVPGAMATKAGAASASTAVIRIPLRIFISHLCPCVTPTVSAALSLACGAGTVVGIVALLRDVTEKWHCDRALNQRVRALEAQVGEVTAQA